MINTTDRSISKAEDIAEKVALCYMGQTPSDEVKAEMDKEYKAELKKAGVKEGLIKIHLDQKSGSIFIYQPEKAPNVGKF